MIDDTQRRSRLGIRHNLANPGTGPSASVEDIARDQVGLHSSDPITPYLSLWARLDSFLVSDLEKTLYEDRNLLRLLGMRRTMFIVPTELGAVMDAACTRALYGAEFRRLIKWVEDQGLAKNGKRWLNRVMKNVESSLAERGDATARELTADVPELALKLSFGEGKSYGGTIGMSTRVLFLMATAGSIVRGRPMGSWVSSQYRWALLDSWAGPLGPLDEDEARVELVSRWLSAYGPGTFTDIKWWTGWGVGVTRKALETLGAVEVELSDGMGFLHPADSENIDDCSPWTALLPGLDPTTMGWKERGWYLDGHVEELFDRNGNAGPTVWANGRVVGGWTQLESGQVAVKLLEHVPRAQRTEIDEKATALQEWLGDTRIKTRFSVPLERELKELG